MSRLSDKLFITFNIVALISGCLAIGSYIYFQMNGVTDCKNVVQKPLIAMGVVLAAISVLGLIGIIWKFTSLLWLYSVVALLTLLGLTALSAFIYAIDNANGSGNLSTFGFKKHNLGENYSEWLRNMVESGKNWIEIRTCLVENHVCNRVRDNNFFQHDSHFHLMQHASPIENGCCKPPIECGYIYKNGTWAAPKAGSKRRESDCKIWSNDENKLCYNCKACKGGVVEESRMTWIIFSVLDFFDITILIVMFTLSCCTRFHILSDSKYHKLQRPGSP